MGRSKNHLEKFITQISITGIRECYQTKHITIRIIWIFWLFFGFIMTLYFMSIIIEDYRSNPTVTKVYYDVNETYLFPQTFFYIERSDDFLLGMGMSHESIAYVQSWKTFDLHSYQNRTLYSLGKSNLKRFAKKFGLKNVSDLYFIANKYDNTTSIFCFRCKNEMIHLNSGLVLNGRVTYEVEFKPFNGREVSLEEYGMLIYGSHTNQNYYLNLGKSRHLLNHDDDIELYFNSKYEIRVNAHRMRRHEKNSMTCTKQEAASFFSCVKSCKYLVYEKCGNCQYVLHGNESLFHTHKPLCSLLIYDIFGECHRENTRNISLCSKRCLPLCEETIYQFNIHKLQGYNENINVLFLLNYVDSGILTYEETPSFSFHTAISNVGGQLGLWLGMSLITLVQLCMFCLSRLLDRRGRKR